MTTRRSVSLLGLFLVAFLCPVGHAQEQAASEEIDVLIVGGRVYDGTGSPWIDAAVGIDDDRIAYVGPRSTAPAAAEVVDVGGLVVSPGFIDVHTHTLASLREPRRAPLANYLTQGVTTVIAGNDGGGPWRIAETLALVEKVELGVNMGLLVGHATVRREVIGDDDRAPTADELDEMRRLVEAGMLEGGFGLSTGLYYAPGSYASTDEVIALAEVAAALGGLYDSHIRDESDYTVGLVATVDEAIAVGAAANLPVHIARIKALGPDSWGLSARVVERIEKARADGVEVTADQYPYPASATSITGALMPRWSLAGGRPALLERLQDRETRDRILGEVADNMRRRGGADSLLISSAQGAQDLSTEQLAGSSLARVAESWQVSPQVAALRILEAGGAGLVSFNMSEDDLRRFRRQPWVMTGSDGGSVLPGEGVPHPRSYGTFARAIARFVREEGLLSLAQAIRAATYLPAQTYRMWNRGILRAGAAADIVVFDPEDFTDRASFDEPHAYSTGIAYLWVNGVAAIHDGELTGGRAGRGLRRR